MLTFNPCLFPIKFSKAIPLKRRFILIVLIICICRVGHAQKKINEAYTLTEEKWLPRQSIRTIFQDSKGNMWVGTNAGLYKYNLFAAINYNFSQKTPNRLVNNTIHAIGEDVNGNIVVGTESGLGALHPLTGELTVISSSDKTILEIKKAKDGSLWILNGTGEIFRIDSNIPLKQSNFIIPFLKTSDFVAAGTKVNTLSPMDDGGVLVGTSEGVFKLEPQKRRLKRTAIKSNVNFLFARNYKTIFVGTEAQGLIVIRSANEELTSLIQSAPVRNATTPVTSVLPGEPGKILLTTSQQVGFVSEEPNGPTFTPVSSNTEIFSEGSLSVAFVDRTNTIWLGSKRGLYRLQRQALQVSFILLPGQQALSKNVTDVLFDGSHYLFALNATGNITRINLQSGKKENIHTPFSSVSKIRRAANGTFVLLADKKLVEISDASFYTNRNIYSYRLLYPNEAHAEINDFREVEPGEWWLTSWNAGLILVNQKLGLAPSPAYEIAKKSLPATAHLFSILADRHGYVWVATRGEGLLKVNLAEKSVMRFGKENGLSNRLICVKEDSKGNIWVGARGDGLFLFNPQNNNFRSFDIPSGLPSNTICAMEENSAGEWWISTLNGLAKYKPGQLMPFLSFGAEDGINNPEHNFNVSANDEKGGVYFGNGNGLYQVIQKPLAQTSTFPVQWTQLEVLKGDGFYQPKNEAESTGLLDRFLQSGQPIQLAYNDNNLRIAFAALDFTNPEKNRYAYRLVGIDTAWQFRIGEKISVQYFNLPPGNYTLQVKSATSEGGWTPEAQRLSFIIQPSFWASRDGYILYAFVLAGGLMIALLLRRRWLRLNKKLTDEIQLGQRHNQQMVFYTDLSHEIKNRITLILGPLEQALQGKKVNKSVLHSLYDQGLRLKKLTDQIMNIRKRESGSFLLNIAEEHIGNKIEALCKEAEPMAVLKNLQFSIDHRKESITGWCDEELLEIIVMNLLGNAVKYCRVGGSVTLKTDVQYLGKADIQQLECEGNYLLCSITDTGIGIPEEEIEKITAPFYRAQNIRFNKKEITGTGIGLNLVARLIKTHHGQMQIRSQVGEFTAVSFYLPIDKHSYTLSELRPNLDHAPVVMETSLANPATPELIFPAGQTGQQEALPSPQQFTILLADDDPEILNLLQSILKEDFKLVIAPNGAKALELLKQHDVHLVLSDLDMPLMDGLTFCRRVKDSKEWKDIPFLILTGLNSEEQKLVCFKSGVDDFIEKPFSNELLRWRVKSLLQNRVAKARLKTVVVIEPKGNIPQNADDKFIEQIVCLIDKNIDKDFLDVDFLAENLFTSRATFYRRMEQLVGESPSVFIRKYRLKKAAMLLEKGHTINAAAAQTGFSSAKYFAKCFQKEFGITPAQFSGQQTES